MTWIPLQSCLPCYPCLSPSLAVLRPLNYKFQDVFQDSVKSPEYAFNTRIYHPQIHWEIPVCQSYYMLRAERVTSEMQLNRILGATEGLSFWVFWVEVRPDKAQAEVILLIRKKGGCIARLLGALWIVADDWQHLLCLVCLVHAGAISCPVFLRIPLITHLLKK